MKFVNFINNAQNLLKVLQHLFQKKKKKKNADTDTKSALPRFQTSPMHPHTWPKNPSTH